MTMVRSQFSIDGIEYINITIGDNNEIFDIIVKPFNEEEFEIKTELTLEDIDEVFSGDNHLTKEEFMDWLMVKAL